jgi:hypothetical protein
MMNRSIISIALVLVTSFCAFSQKSEIKRIDPQFWWHNLETRELQLMVYGLNTAKFDVKVKTPGVSLTNVQKLENPNYLLVYLNLEEYHGNQLLLDFTADGKTKTITYALQTLQKLPHQMEASEFVYLVFPDRFSNGDPKNDVIKEYATKVEAIFDRQDNLEMENQKLTELRDWLLPMLMNGQVKVS